jgi:signal transduction histidine kinase
MADEASARRFRVLVADDEEGMRLAVERALRGFSVTLEYTGETIGMDVVLVDSGEAAISATRKGAYDFLAKPFTPGELRVSLRQAVTHLAAIRKTRELEEEKRRVRFQFISVLAHELKAPLGAIEGYLYVLQDRNAVSDPAVYDRIVDRCQIRLVGMRKLIYDLLDLTRLESGSHRRALVECDLRDAVATSIETMTPDADRRGISILREAPEGQVGLKADPSELGIILNNLISNAVKYNRDGGSITVRLQDLPDQVVIAVSDTGIGMSEEELGKLFQEFTRIRNAKTKDILCSGLGLTILQKLTSLYGGTVTVESTPDVGSTFTVNLMKNTAAV